MDDLKEAVARIERASTDVEGFRRFIAKGKVA
jgi:hypothetical protein